MKNYSLHSLLQERNRLDRLITSIQTFEAELSMAGSAPSAGLPPARGRRSNSAPTGFGSGNTVGNRTISAEGRQRIAAATKKRWAVARKTAQLAGTPAQLTAQPQNNAPRARRSSRKTMSAGTGEGQPQIS